jgi:hypothetical protein
VAKAGGGIGNITRPVGKILPVILIDIFYPVVMSYLSVDRWSGFC